MKLRQTNNLLRFKCVYKQCRNCTFNDQLYNDKPSDNSGKIVIFTVQNMTDFAYILRYTRITMNHGKLLKTQI